MDDADLDVVRVNHAMVGIAVPPGSHVVRLRLEPTSIWIGAGISGGSVFLMAGVALAALRRKAQVPEGLVPTAVAGR